MLLGALSGDRSLYATGLVTYGAGTIARDANVEKTVSVQTAAIRELQEKQRAESDADLGDLEQRYRMLCC